VSATKAKRCAIGESVGQRCARACVPPRVPLLALRSVPPVRTNLRSGVYALWRWPLGGRLDATAPCRRH
jgi:hypothetical protein